MLRPVRYLAPALALLILAGCGEEGPTPEEQVRSTVSEFARATAAKDYGVLCDRVLAPDLIEDVESIGLPCERALEQGLGGVEDPRLTIGRISVNEDDATVEVRSSAAGEEPSQDTLELVNLDGSWKISSLGT
jgi:Putative lumazine-binding